MINLSINNVDIKARHINSDLFYCVDDLQRIVVGPADYSNSALYYRVEGAQLLCAGQTDFTVEV
jgi:hypothetical protein